HSCAAESVLQKGRCTIQFGARPLVAGGVHPPLPHQERGLDAVTHLKMDAKPIIVLAIGLWAAGCRPNPELSDRSDPHPTAMADGFVRVVETSGDLARIRRDGALEDDDQDLAETRDLTPPPDSTSLPDLSAALYLAAAPDLATEH